MWPAGKKQSPKINRDSPGKFDIFSNEEHGAWTSWPNTILIDSEQLESGKL